METEEIVDTTDTLEFKKNEFSAVLKEKDYNEFLYQELETANLKEDELEELEQQYQTLSNVEFIKENLDKRNQKMKQGIFSGNNEQPLQTPSETLPVVETVEDIEPQKISLKSKDKTLKENVRGRLNLTGDEEDEKIRKQMEMFNQV